MIESVLLELFKLPKGSWVSPSQRVQPQGVVSTGAKVNGI